MITIAIFTYKRIKKLIDCVSSIDHSLCNEILIFNDDEENSLKNTPLTNIENIKQKIKIFDPQDFGFTDRKFRKPIYMNKAVKISKSDKILFSDDDGIFGPDSIGIHINALNNNHFCAGSIRRNLLLKNHTSYNILQGTNISFHNKTYHEIGGYDEEFVNTGGGGDVDFWFRIHNYIIDNSLKAAYLRNAYQRVKGISNRKKDPIMAKNYTSKKHGIKQTEKMYRWFPNIRNKEKWMQVIE